MKSVTALEANLPIAWHSSVHVAVDENRQDVMRVLILPDQDTPYANGAFVFDMFLPAEFPDVPPKVRALFYYFFESHLSCVRLFPSSLRMRSALHALLQLS